MKISSALVLLIIGLFSSFTVFSCKSRVAADLPPLSKEGVSGKKLWDHINSNGSYTKLPYWPGHDGMYPGQAPHGTYHKIFINHTLHSSLPLSNKRVPNGSIVIKENYNANKKLSAITLMAKVEGFDTEHNDWYWVKYNNNGKVLAEGSPTGCINCHEPMKTNDYIIVRPLDKAVD